MNSELLTNLAVDLFFHLTEKEQKEIILSLTSAPSE